MVGEKIKILHAAWNDYEIQMSGPTFWNTACVLSAAALLHDGRVLVTGL